MKLKSIIVIVLCVCVCCVSIQAADPACGGAEKTAVKDTQTPTVVDTKSATTAPADEKTATTAPATKDTTSPAEAPASTTAPVPAPKLVLPPKLPDVAATVGKKTISGKEINEEIAKVGTQMQQQLASAPPEQRMMVFGFFQKQLTAGPSQILDNKIFKLLLDAYIAENNIPCPEDKVKALKDQLAEAAKKNDTTLEKMMAEKNVTDEQLKAAVQTQILQEQTTSGEKVQALAKAHPEYFNGTKVQASHILIPSQPMAATADQKAALDKLEKIRADIEAKKNTFEEAAAKYSSCPSKSEGGDLGEFTAEKMAPGFSIAAFALKPGQISPVVHTQFGFHIVKLIKRTDGTEKIDPKNLSPETQKLAKGILMSQVQDKIVELGLTSLPIVINK